MIGERSVSQATCLQHLLLGQNRHLQRQPGSPIVITVLNAQYLLDYEDGIQHRRDVDFGFVVCVSSFFHGVMAAIRA